VGSLTTEKKWTEQQEKHARKTKILLKASDGLARSSAVGLAGTSSECSVVPDGEKNRVTMGILPSVIQGK
jgi:hypothetical protein